MANSCESNFTIDLSNVTSIPIHMVYMPREWVIYEIVWPCIVLCGLFSNLTFIWTVIKTPELHTITFKYLVSLAISDTLTVLCFGIPNIVHFTTRKLRDQPLEFDLISTFFFLCSTGILTLVSVERFFAICHPLKHHLINGTKRTNLLICMIWTIAFIYTLSVYPTINPSTFCVIWPEYDQFRNYPTYFHQVGFTWIFIYILTPLFIFFFLFLMVSNVYIFGRMYFAMHKRMNQNLSSSIERESQLRQVVVMLLVNSLIFFLCCSLKIQVMVMGLVFAIAPETLTPQHMPMLQTVSRILLGVNASINPILYFTLNKRYRNAFKMIILKRTDKRNPRNNQTIIELSASNNTL